MDEIDIEILSGRDNLDEVSIVLQRFLKNNEETYIFSNLSESDKRVLVWTALFQHLQRKSSISIHFLCLAAIRVLSRDNTELESLICEKWITTLIEKAGLYNFIDSGEDPSTSVELLDKEVAVEALKCLCNITYHSEVARAICAHTSISQGLIARFKIYKEIPFKYEIMLFDMKVLFILTALRQDIRAKIKNILNGMDCLINCLNDILLEAISQGKTLLANDRATAIERIYLEDLQQDIVCEILKAQFNLLLNSGSVEPSHDAETAIFTKLMPILKGYLLVSTSNAMNLMELRSNITNLLSSVPPSFYNYLSPELKEGEKAEFTYLGRNMDALQALVDFLQYSLTITPGRTNQYEFLAPILTVMNKSARGCRAHRKYLRQVVLPPLRDVSSPPEQGFKLRNQLCKLLTSPITFVRDLVADFLFILCKEKVGRMVKYTGFGNAAGHLAQRGLLGGGRGADYSSSSDDSDTEEYKEAQPRIDPVVGCTRPPRVNPFENMSDEQKEYEAMKLVNMFDKMVSQGIVKPARVGPDGRPQPIEHVLELRENPPTRPQS
ncbi:hypothetical protein K1T71_004965 [Dendrolimus kikuchii]|uniref:Uncharacterized protein n=1 Tax=Dendrolimus kikuchii TaxID=765133 RepID=A0ACC1D5T7_9NEOP|nr:hypothetical protein K1T71_004965 [Dendrolimus kikuchii]